MTRRTRSLVSRLMEGLSLQVRETVEGETPAAAATSLMVTAIICSSLIDYPYCKDVCTQCQCLRKDLHNSCNIIFAFP